MSDGRVWAAAVAIVTVWIIGVVLLGEQKIVDLDAAGALPPTVYQPRDIVTAATVDPALPPHGRGGPVAAVTTPPPADPAETTGVMSGSAAGAVVFVLAAWGLLAGMKRCRPTPPPRRHIKQRHWE